MLADGFPCTDMGAPVSLATACFWNLFEDRWAPPSGPIVVSVEMRRLASLFMRSSRNRDKVLMAMTEYAKQHHTTLRDPAVDRLFHAEIRRLIADGCAAVLPAETLAGLKARAAKGPSWTIEQLVAEFR